MKYPSSPPLIPKSKTLRRTYRKRNAKETGKPKLRVNEQISAPELFVIDESGNQLGAMPTDKALDMARERGYDLVEVSPKAKPPVARFADYGKLQYQESRQQRKAKAQQKKTETKNLRLSTRISQNDFDLRIKQATKFLQEGHRVHIQLMLRGRENQHPDVSKQVVEKFITQMKESMGDGLHLDAPPKHKGNKIDSELSFKKQ